MRAKEFIKEATINVPDQMVTVQVPLKDLVANGGQRPARVVNPGKRADPNGLYKWSPPLQQHLDAVKDAIGPSDDELSVDDSEEVNPGYVDDGLPVDSFRGALTAILSKTPSMPG